MKRNKLFFIAVVALFVGSMTFLTQNKIKSTDLLLANVETLAAGEDIGGGVEITCNTGGSGKCYKPYVKHEYGDYCSFHCSATGNPNDYCNSSWMGVLELCVNFIL